MLGLRKTADTTHRLLQNLLFHGQGIRCIRIGNTEVPDNKKLLFSLQYIKGIGRTTARQIVSDLQIGNKTPKELSGLELDTLRNELLNYTTGHNLDKEQASSVKRLMDIQCYRGSRHQHGFPCRGQRTTSNARTGKGRAIPIAGMLKPSC